MLSRKMDNKNYEVILKMETCVSENSLCGMMTISVGRHEPGHVQYPKFLSLGRVLKLRPFQSQ